MNAQPLKRIFAARSMRNIAAGISTLALAQAANVTAANANEVPTIPAPQKVAVAQPAPVLPPYCLAFNDLSRNTQPYDSVLKSFTEKLQSYTGWQTLMERVTAVGGKISGVCAKPYDPRVTQDDIVPNRAGPLSTLDINILKLERDPNGRPKIGVFSPEEVNEGLDETLVQQAVSTMASKGFAGGAEPLVQPGDGVDSAVILKSAAVANEASEDALYAVDMFERTGKRDLLEDVQKKFQPIASDINDLWSKAVDHQDDGTTLTAAEKEDFRHTVFLKTIKSPALRSALYMIQVKNMAGMVMMTQDISIFDAPELKDTELNARFSRFGVTGIDLAAISAELVKTKGDPSPLVHKTIADIKSKLLSGQSSPDSGNDATPAQPAPPSP